LGRPKQLVILEGETLVARAVRIATEAELIPVIAVVPDASMIEALQAMGALVVLNRRPYEGISSSIHVGVRAAQTAKSDGAVIMTCDQIAVTPEHLQILASETDVATGSAYAGRIGIPAYFPAASFEALLKLEGDTGARDLLLTARSVPTEDLAFDIDTEADLARALAGE
jgi:CTP:molybdopterin cytidylyltransferase MocA